MHVLIIFELLLLEIEEKLIFLIKSCDHEVKVLTPKINLSSSNPFNKLRTYTGY